jgi:hypothetical protein
MTLDRGQSEAYGCEHNLYLVFGCECGCYQHRGGGVDGSKKIGGDEIKNVLGQM